MKYLKKILILFMFFSKTIGAEEEKPNYFDLGLYQSIFQTNYLEGQNREKNLQNVFFSGIEYSYRNFPKEDDFYSIELNQVLLYNLQFKEDEEVLERRPKEPEKLYLYNFQNSFVSLSYKNFFLALGYINPYFSLLEKNKNQEEPYSKISYFPSFDVRFDFLNSIFTISPIFLYEKEQKFVTTIEEKNYALIHHFKKNNLIEKYKNNLNYKLHYTFISKWFDFYLGYYNVYQENQYSNQKNYLELDFYDSHFVFKIYQFLIRLQISQSKGFFSKGKYNYKIYGNRYIVFLNYKMDFFQILIEGSTSERSKWNSIKNQWEYFGFTSIFSDYVSTLQMSSTFKLSSNYEICYNIENICEGITFLEGDNNSIVPAKTGFLKLKFFYKFYEFLISFGYYEKEKIKKRNFLEEFKMNLEPISFIGSSKEDSKKEFLEPNLALIVNSKKIKTILNYSKLFKKDYNSKKFKELSESLFISFMYNF
ncbi:MAG: hypothetical protein ACK4UJ_06995 [Leptonema sp. (in: bacteria)]